MSENSNSNGSGGSNGKPSKTLRTSSAVFIRRCHVCSGVSESQGQAVQQCQHCEKPMAPFYFFSEINVEPLAEHKMRPPLEIEQLAGERLPIRGFSAIW